MLRPISTGRRGKRGGQCKLSAEDQLLLCWVRGISYSVSYYCYERFLGIIPPETLAVGGLSEFGQVYVGWTQKRNLVDEFRQVSLTAKKLPPRILDSWR